MSPELVEFLYRTRRAHSVRRLHRMLGDFAEDAVQEVFAKLLGAHAAHDGRACVTAWLDQVVLNRGISELRRERRVLPGDEPCDIESPEVGALAAERAARLKRAMAQLNERDRDLLLLHAFESLSQPEIARRLGIPEGTVKSRLNRARARLRRHLEAEP
jgi:RNA polymerase sigma-70 factor (ECF subfamily)